MFFLLKFDSEALLAGLYKALIVIGVIIAVWIVARLLATLLRKLLVKLKADKLGEKLNEVDIFRQFKIEFKFSKILSKLFFWLVMLFAIMVAADKFQLTTLSGMINDFIAYIPDLLMAVVMVLGGLFLANTVKDVVGAACRSFGIKVWKAIGWMVFSVLAISFTISALNIARIDTAMISTIVTIVIGGVVLAFSVAYGLASRNVLASILSNYYNKNLYEIGQIIEVDGHKGKIVRMDGVSVTLDMGESKAIFPLNRLLNGKVIVHKDK